MPNQFNFAFDYYWACWAAVFAYLPGEALASECCQVASGAFPGDMNLEAQRQAEAWASTEVLPALGIRWVSTSH